MIYVYGCVIAFYLLIVSKIIKKAHSHSGRLSEQAVTRVRILRHFNVVTAAISHWSVSAIDIQLKNQKNTKTKNKTSL